MVSIRHVETFRAAPEVFLSSLSDLEIVEIDGRDMLYSATPPRSR